MLTLKLWISPKESDLVWTGRKKKRSNAAVIATHAWFGFALNNGWNSNQAFHYGDRADNENEKQLVDRIWRMSYIREVKGRQFSSAHVISIYKKRKNCNAGLLEEILKVHKRCARIILGAPFQASTLPLFLELGWLPINQICIDRRRNFCSRKPWTDVHRITSLRNCYLWNTTSLMIQGLGCLNNFLFHVPIVWSGCSFAMQLHCGTISVKML